MSTQNPAAHPTNPASNPGSTSAVPPKQVTIAFWLYIAAAVLSLIALIVSLTTVDALKSTMRQQLEKQGSDVSNGTIDAAVSAGVTVSVVLGILYLAAFVVFAYFMRRGANWARIVLLIITALSLLGVAGGDGLGIARVVLGVIATVLIFMKPASDYFRATKAAKAR
jgi:hypothetical protein